ncbi:hypothetical protein BN946_scf184632.g10 [Trametes cinnabarina]|uniref:Uncharacterized protein n=1 Tax=Pycnoporus cinnabarinus TaxID=5643 RepID=A0A060SQ24_PYCCI|nr:hypothetical protein BN946_scf184632.g10 [Trametes cinnabarina]
MHEFVRELRRVSSNARYDDHDDGEYDVFYYYPSRNELLQFPADFRDIEDDASSEYTIYDEGMKIVSPTYTIDPEFSFADNVDDGPVASMGYSRTFQLGLFSQSSRITKRLDAFIEKTLATIRSFRQHFTRQPSPRQG